MPRAHALIPWFRFPWPRFPAPPDGAVRLGLFYALVMAGTSVSGPFIAPWFSAHGLSGGEIGVILGAPMFARLFSAPLLGVWADSHGLRRTPLMLLATVATASYVALALSRGFAAWLVLWLIAATAMGAIAPLTDVFTLRRGRRERFSFGWPRGVGSLAYIAGNIVMGLILARGRVDAVVVWIVLASAAAAIFAGTILPDEPVREGGPAPRAERFRGLGRLCADPRFMLAIASIGLINASNSFYHGFASLVWIEAGVPRAAIGLLWASGVAAEVGFLWFLAPMRRRLGAERLILLSGAGAIVRWTAFAMSPPLWLIFPLQMLHALTFTASYVGGLELVERLSPPDSHSAAQTLNAAVASGGLVGPATMISGALFERYGAHGYLAMAVMAAAGLTGMWRLGRMPPEPGPLAHQ